jgi:hypothetical protein
MKDFFIVVFLFLGAVLVAAACAYRLTAGKAAWAGDFNDRDTALAVIWVRHDLGYESDTVMAIVSWRYGGGWYVRTPDGERWSDREPKIITRER